MSLGIALALVHACTWAFQEASRFLSDCLSSFAWLSSLCLVVLSIASGVAQNGLMPAATAPLTSAGIYMGPAPFNADTDDQSDVL